MSKAQSIIEQFYQEEQSRIADEATFSPLDISISGADMAMISTIAKRFSKDKALLAREALGQALQDMFDALEPAERKMLAKDADELAVSIAAEIAEEQGLDKLEVSGTNWVMQDKNCIKAERKAEKEKAKQQQQTSKQVLANDPTEAVEEVTVEEQMDDVMDLEEDTMTEEPSEIEAELDDSSKQQDSSDSVNENVDEEEETSNNSIFA